MRNVAMQGLALKCADPKMDAKKERIFVNAISRIFIMSALLTVPAISNGGEDYENLNISYSVRYRGQCTASFSDARKISTDICKGMGAVVFKHGRILYYFPYTENEVTKIIAFSGGVDRQPSLSHYELDIDTVINSDVNKRTHQKSLAKGLCTMDGDPNALATFKCNAIISAPNTFKKYEFVFESNGVESYAASASP